MLSSPCRPVRTMRIFSSAENWRRVARRISFTTCLAGSFTDPDFCPIFAPSMATMGQKSSLPQPAPSVSLSADAGHYLNQPVVHDTAQHYLAGTTAQFDAILVDLYGPAGPAESDEMFWVRCLDALARPAASP